MIWKIYAWVLLGLLVLSWKSLFGAEIRGIDRIDLPISVIGLIGIFGFSFKRPFLRPEFWRVWAFAQPFWDVYYNIAGTGGDTARTALVFAIALPGYVALFLYGFRSPALWRFEPGEEAESRP